MLRVRMNISWISPIPETAGCCQCRGLLWVYKLYSANGEEIPFKDKVNVKKYNRQFIYFHSERAYRVQFSSKKGFRIKITDVHLKNLGFYKSICSKIRTCRHKLAKAILRAIYNFFYLIPNLFEIHILKP